MQVHRCSEFYLRALGHRQGHWLRATDMLACLAVITMVGCLSQPPQGPPSIIVSTSQLQRPRLERVKPRGGRATSAQAPEPTPLLLSHTGRELFWPPRGEASFSSLVSRREEMVWRAHAPNTRDTTVFSPLPTFLSPQECSLRWKETWMYASHCKGG